MSNLPRTPVWLAVLLITGAALSLDAGKECESAENPSVSFASKTTSLQEVTAELATSTQSNLGVSQELASLPLLLSVHERAGERVRAEVAGLVNGMWTRYREDPSNRVTLVLDQSARQFRRERLLRWYGTSIEALRAYARNSLSEAQSGGKPLSQDRRAALKMLLLLQPEQFLACVTGGLYLRWRDMSPETRELTRTIIRGMAANAPKKWPPGNQGQALVESTGLLLSAGVTESNLPGSYNVRVGDAGLSFRMPLWARIPEWARKSVDRTPVRGAPYPERKRPPGATASPAQPAGYADLEKLPFPAKGFQESFPGTWTKIFAQLGRRLPFALYSDGFTGLPVGRSAGMEAGDPEGPQNPARIPVERLSVAAALDALCKRYGRIWWREGDALFFRSRTWFLDEQYVVPRPVLQRLAEQVQTSGRIDEKSLELLAQLSPQQLHGMHRIVEELYGPVAWSGRTLGVFWLLRVYQMLSGSQKSRVLRDGLPVVAMTPQQQRAYREALFVSRAPLAMIRDPGELYFDQNLTRDSTTQKPKLCMLSFYLAPSQMPQGTNADAMRRRPRLASLTIPLALDDNSTDPNERSDR